MVNDVVARTDPSQQAPLIKFVRTLQQQKAIDPATGDQLRFDQDYNKLVWTEVPNFGINVADNWTFGTRRSPCTSKAHADRFNIDASNSSRDPREEFRYYNKVAFLAKLTSSSANFVPNPEKPSGPFDFSLYALWSFRNAFEETAEPRAPNNILLRSAALSG